MLEETNNKLQEKSVKYYFSLEVAEPCSSPESRCDLTLSISLYDVEDEEKYNSCRYVEENKFKSVKEMNDAPRPDNRVPLANDYVLDLSLPKKNKNEESGSQSEKVSMNHFNLSKCFEKSDVQQFSELKEIAQEEKNVSEISTKKCDIEKQEIYNNDINNNLNLVQESNDLATEHNGTDKNPIDANENLLLLANCSLIYGRIINTDSKVQNSSEINIESSEDFSSSDNDTSSSESILVRDTVIKSNMKWDQIYKNNADETIAQSAMSPDFGFFEFGRSLRFANHSPEHWEIVRNETHNKSQKTSVNYVNRLVLRRRKLPKSRIPKLVIKKIGGEYRSYFRME